MIGYRHEYGRQHIESLEFIAQYAVQPYRHDYCVADIAYLPEHLALQQPAERARKQRDAALIDEQRYERKYHAEAERRAENYCGDKVYCALDKEHGAVARQAVVYRADYRHCTDAKEQGAVDKARSEAAFFEFFLDPVAKISEPILKPQHFADKRTDHKEHHEQQLAAAHELAVLLCEHIRHYAVYAYDEYRETEHTVDALGMILFYSFFKQQPYGSARCHGGTVNKRSRH